MGFQGARAAPRGPFVAPAHRSRHLASSPLHHAPHDERVPRHPAPTSRARRRGAAHLARPTWRARALVPQAYKQMVKLHFKRNNHSEMMSAYQQMLTYIKSAVTRNYSEKASQTRGGEAAPPPAVCLALRSPSPTTALRAGDQQGA